MTTPAGDLSTRQLHRHALDEHLPRGQLRSRKLTHVAGPKEMDLLKGPVIWTPPPSAFTTRQSSVAVCPRRKTFRQGRSGRDSRHFLLRRIPRFPHRRGGGEVYKGSWWINNYQSAAATLSMEPTSFSTHGDLYPVFGPAPFSSTSDPRARSAERHQDILGLRQRH